MGKERLSVTLLMILIFPAFAAAASEEGRWELIGKSRTETLWYIDAENLSRPSSDVISVWLKTVPAKTDTDLLEGEESTEIILKKIQTRNFGGYEYTLGLWEIDCSKGIFRILYFAAFNKRDETIASSLTPDAEWSFTVSGSVSEVMHEKLCGR